MCLRVELYGSNDQSGLSSLTTLVYLSYLSISFHGYVEQISRPKKWLRLYQNARTIKKCLITVSESLFPGHSCARVRHQLEVFNYHCNSFNVKSKMPSFSLLQSLLLTYNIMLKSYLWTDWRNYFICYFSSSKRRPENFRLE